MTNPSRMPFRRDIQGLRAVAVIAVIAYHFNLGLPGGFLGVDVFFVISGFVITQLLVHEIENHQRVRLKKFFSRRFMRLAPALSLTALLTALGSFFLLAPSPRQEEILWTGLGSVFGVSNAVIERLSGGYFGSAPETNALVHTWSLSVEWQFYLLFPLVVLFAATVARNKFISFHRLFFVIIVATSTLSFISTFLPGWVGGSGPIATLFGFYSPISRVWEFGAGILVYLISQKVAPQGLGNHFLIALGSVLIAFGVLTGNPGNFSPGTDAFLPVLGTSLLLLTGSNSETNHRNLIGRALQSRVMFAIGERSYSWYLWHWPVAYLLKEFTGLSLFQTGIVIIIGTLMAEVSYRLLEKPFRRQNDSTQRPRRRLVVTVATPMILLVFFVPALPSLSIFGQNNGAWVMIHEGDTGHQDFHSTVAQDFWPCTPAHLRESALSWRGFLRCQQSKPTGAVDFAIIGDSHAEHLFLGLAETLKNRNVAYFIAGDLPIPEKDARISEALQHIYSDPHISDVLITAYWAGRGLPFGDLKMVVRDLESAGKNVFLTNDVPAFKTAPWFCQSTPRFSSLGLLDKSSCESNASAGNLMDLNSELQTLSREQNIYFIDTYSAFCKGKVCSMTHPEKGLLYRDAHHLNLNGSRFVAITLVAAITAATEEIGQIQKDS